MSFTSSSKSLVAAVHDILGPTRDSKSRLPDATGAALTSGLQIRKDSEFGPDSDGQYHH